jgi:hypothetical protein
MREVRAKAIEADSDGQLTEFEFNPQTLRIVSSRRQRLSADGFQALRARVERPAFANSLKPFASAAPGAEQGDRLVVVLTRQGESRRVGYGLQDDAPDQVREVVRSLAALAERLKGTNANIGALRAEHIPEPRASAVAARLGSRVRDSGAFPYGGRGAVEAACESPDHFQPVEGERLAPVAALVPGAGELYVRRAGRLFKVLVFLPDEHRQ